MRIARYFQGIFFLIPGLFACEHSTKKDVNSAENKNQDIAFIDTSSLQAYLLYDDKYILSISLLDHNGKKIPGTRFGLYNKKGDTIFVACPELASEGYNKIKTKYFWIEMYSGKYNNGKELIPADSLYQEVFYKEPVLIADSLFGTKFFDSKLLDTSTTLVYVPFVRDTLLVRGNKIVGIREK
jgi:hypothetical protein